MTKEKCKVAASVTLDRPGKMTARGRKQIAEWLIQQADDLVSHGAQYNDTGAFRARYYYQEVAR